MQISLDPKTYLLSKIRYKYKYSFLEGLLPLGQKQGPQEFLISLVQQLRHNYQTQFVSLPCKSDLHILNSGNYISLWNHFQLKPKSKVLLRIDGIGFDTIPKTSLKYKKQYTKINSLISKSNYLIFQSRFCKSVFESAKSV